MTEPYAQAATATRATPVAEHTPAADVLGRVTLTFAVAFAAFIVGPAVVGRGAFPLEPDMHWQDVLDLATPIVMLPLYWLLVRQWPSAPPLSRVGFVAFLVLGAIWVEAQGMHLAANSIDNRLGAATGDPVASLTHFYDEVLSHLMWDGATIGLMALALARQERYRLVGVPASLGLETVAGFVYGLAFFINVVESGTGALGVPAAAILATLALGLSGRSLRAQPIAAFVLVAHAVALVLFAAWWLYWGGSLPEFTQVGWY
jgi:hypothetical protein